MKDAQWDPSQLDAFLEEAHPRKAFSATGILSGLEGYEFRPAQIDMASLVWEVMERGGDAGCEGPGPGNPWPTFIPPSC